MICERCGQEIEYDEGVGNAFDGYICFECDDEINQIQHDTQIGDQHCEPEEARC